MVVGGTSAGLAIFGQYVYTSQLRNANLTIRPNRRKLLYAIVLSGWPGDREQRAKFVGLGRRNH